MKIYCLTEALHITGDDTELCILGKTLESIGLHPYWQDEGDTLILDDDKNRQDKIIALLKAYFELRNLDYEILGDSH